MGSLLRERLAERANPIHVTLREQAPTFGLANTATFSFAQRRSPRNHAAILGSRRAAIATTGCLHWRGEFGAPRTRKLHKRLHTHRTCDDEQVALNEKSP